METLVHPASRFLKRTAMVRVAHKYMPGEAPEEERIATFAARHHTLDYLTKILRDQVSSRTLNSALITGPRGAGKTTLVLMLVHRIEHDEALRRAWLPVRFAEELPGVTSLRDLLSEALRIQTEDGVAGAREWHEKAEAEDNDDQSLEIAALGLRQIAQTQQRRFLFFVENLDLVFDRGLDEQEEAHLRRLLMDDPFFMILGTAVRLFPQLTDYEKAFFNYFNEVSLPRLDDREVEELLLKRAEYHNNDIFKQRYAQNRPSIRAISRLTGGNPRLVTDLYEIFSEHRIEPVVSLLRKTIDELTPLLKDVLEGLTPQQGKVLDALMRRGGSASPSEIAGAARLGLNTVTTQLTRLREAQLVEVHGGGKGRKAYYIVPDQLFCTWHQMRYLRPNRRRIELIVEFLRVCFDEEDRLAHLRELLAQRAQAGSDRSVTAEYFAASLIATDHERLASELAVQSWLDEGRMAEAAFALAEFDSDEALPADKKKYAAYAHAELGRWLEEHGGEEKAEAAYREALRIDPNNTDAQFNLALILARGGEEAKAILLWTSVISYPTTHLQVVARSLFNRGVAKSQLSNTQGAIDDYSAILQLEDAPVDQVADSLLNRGVTKGQQGDTQGAIDDFSAVLQLEAAPVDQIAKSLLNRGVTKGQQGDTQGAIDDFSAVLQLEDAPVDQIARSLFSRGVAKGRQGDTQGAIDDYSAVLQLVDAPVDQVARSLFSRGVTKGQQGDTQGAIDDYSAVLQLEAAPVDQIAKSLVNRAITMGQPGDTQGAIDDYSAVLQLEDAPVDQIAISLVNRGVTKGRQGDTQGEIDDYSAVLQLEDAPVDQIDPCQASPRVGRATLRAKSTTIPPFSNWRMLRSIRLPYPSSTEASPRVGRATLRAKSTTIPPFSNWRMLRSIRLPYPSSTEASPRVGRATLRAKSTTIPPSSNWWMLPSINLPNPSSTVALLRVGWLTPRAQSTTFPPSLGTKRYNRNRQHKRCSSEAGNDFMQANR